jgi:hypothetical protein
MKTEQTPSGAHTKFDEICAEIGEWEALPALVGVPTAQQSEPSHEQQLAAIDEQILARLVAPY